MPEFKCLPGIEVAGTVVLSFADAFPESVRSMGRDILVNHGLDVDRIKPNEFYPYQSYLDAQKEIQSVFGAGMLTRIGDETIAGVEFPPDWKTMDVLLPGIDAGYQMQFRGGEAGHYEFLGIDSSGPLTQATVRCNNPLGCAFTRGTFEGLIKRFKPEGVLDIVVRHDDTAPCKQKGGESCTFIISWG